MTVNVKIVNMDSVKIQIVEGALKVFGTYGFKQTTMAMIAEGAGLSRQSVYNHFESKEAILVATSEYMHELAAEKSEQIMLEAVANKEDPVEGVCRMMEVRLGVFMSKIGNSPHFEELVSEHSKYCALKNSEAIAKFNKRLSRFIADLMRLQGWKFVRGVNAEEICTLLSDSIHGLKTAGHPVKVFHQKVISLTRLILAGAIER